MPETEDFKPDTCDAAAYTPVEPHDLKRPVNIHDVADFVVDYINSDKMGLVSIQHLIICEPTSNLPPRLPNDKFPSRPISTRLT